MNSTSQIWLYIISIIGAAAWLPPIITWIKEKYFNNPKISIITDRFLEIGYSVYGPIINLKLAFSSDNNDALINDIRIKLVHEKNDTHLFRWEWFEEEIMQIESPDDRQITPLKRNQRAIAIKVLEETLVEKKIGFHELDYISEYKKCFNLFNEKYHSVLLSDSEAELQNLKKTSEYKDLLDLINSASCWKIGEYKIIITVKCKESSTEFRESFRFQLSKFDIKRLSENLRITDRYFESVYFNKEEGQVLNWIWVYPDKID